MEGNNGTGNNIDRDDWQTPQKLWEFLNTQYCFTFDCCASENNSKCQEFSNKFEYKHKHMFFTYDVCWMNPPFSKAKEMFEHFFKVVQKGVAIYRIDNIETKLWQEILKKSDWVHVFDTRINYEGHSGKGARFGSALVGVGVNIPIGLTGTTIKKFV